MQIYIDSDFKCHTVAEDGLTAVETTAFDGKCAVYIEGYRFVPDGSTWVREDGTVFAGEMVSPWKPWEELDAVQREYEREQYNSLLAQLSEVYESAET
jgi:hypothetical protein